MEIKIVVTPEKFDEVFSIDDWLNLLDLTHKEAYEYMLKFVVDESGKPLSTEDARKLFKTIRKKEWAGYVRRFIEAVGEALVNPTNGSGSDKPPSVEPG